MYTNQYQFHVYVKIFLKIKELYEYLIRAYNTIAAHNPLCSSLLNLLAAHFY